MLLNSFINHSYRIRISVSRKSCAVPPKNGERHIVSNLEKAISIKIVTEDRKGSNRAARSRRQKIVSKRRRAEETKSLKLHYAQKS